MRRMLTHNWTEDMSVTIFESKTEARISIDSTDGDVVGYVVRDLEIPRVAGTVVVKAVEAA
jgi:hypothetical protein